MIPRMKSVLATGLLAAALQLTSAGAAYAHHPEVEITGVRCDGTDYVVGYRSYSWSTNGSEGEHSNIEISVNGVYLTSGSYQHPTYEFSGQFIAQSGGVIVEALADGPWGNGTAGGQSASASAVVPSEPCGESAAGTGRFTGGGKQVDVGVAKITRGLTIHCDLTLSNNLELNWGVGNQFHMTDHIETVRCSDSNLIDQKPPAAPIDTLEGIGTGRYNGRTGYSIRFRLVDAGEPGRDDQMWFRIWETANPANVVLEVPVGSYLTNGNLQAHYDQPHKK